MIERTVRERTVDVDLHEVILAAGLDPEQTRLWASVKSGGTAVWAELVPEGGMSLLEQRELTPDELVATVNGNGVRRMAEQHPGDGAPDEESAELETEVIDGESAARRPRADPRTETLQFIETQLRAARQAGEQFRQAIQSDAPTVTPAAAPHPPSNRHRPKVRDAVFAVFSANPAREYTLAEMHAAVGEYGFSKNAVRSVLYALRNDHAVTAQLGAAPWTPTRYRLKTEPDVVDPDDREVPRD